MPDEFDIATAREATDEYDIAAALPKGAGKGRLLLKLVVAAGLFALIVVPVAYYAHVPMVYAVAVCFAISAALVGLGVLATYLSTHGGLSNEIYTIYPSQVRVRKWSSHTGAEVYYYADDKAVAKGIEFGTELQSRPKLISPLDWCGAFARAHLFNSLCRRAKGLSGVAKANLLGWRFKSAHDIFAHQVQTGEWQAIPGWIVEEFLPMTANNFNLSEPAKSLLLTAIALNVLPMPAGVDVGEFSGKMPLLGVVALIKKAALSPSVVAATPATPAPAPAVLTPEQIREYDKLFIQKVKEARAKRLRRKRQNISNGKRGGGRGA